MGLVNVDERKQQEALRVHYEQEKKKQEEATHNRILRLKRFTLFINPLFCIGFVIMFWILGMSNYYKEV